MQEQTQGLYVHGIFCESVRAEVGGTSTYVGVLEGTVLVDMIPGAFAMLSTVVWISWPVAVAAPKRIALEFAPPGAPPFRLAEEAIPTVPPAPQGAHRHTITMKTQVNNLNFAQSGPLVLTVILDGVRYPVVSMLLLVKPSLASTMSMTRH